ncbi:MAG TPA: ABC transporter permease [Chloroflexota bacterium]|nr:ABC transporter permease [Chloroflexota bacterium]
MWAAAWERLRRDRLTLAAGLVFFGLCILALLADPINAYALQRDPNAQVLTATYQGPSPTHWFGTDEYGRDSAARVIQASRVSLTMGFMVAAIALTIGVMAGLVAAQYGGWVDDLVTFVVNLFSITPTFYVLLILAAWVPPSLVSLALLIAAFGWMGVTRQVRGVSLSIARRDYVLAARALGATDGRIMLRHVLPNVSSIVTIVAGLEVAGAILAESGLSFVGLGIRPPTPSWGNMLTNSLQYVFRDPWLVILPGAFIFVTILSVYLLADGLRDALDPRLR